MPVVPLTGRVKASEIRYAVNDIDVDGPGNLNYNQISLSTALDKLRNTPHGRTNAPASGELSFSDFRGSQAISVYISVRGETPNPGYDDKNDGVISVNIVASKVSGNVSTTINGGPSKSGINPAPWTGLNTGTYTVRVTDNATGFFTSMDVTITLTTSTSHYTINVA